MPRVARLVVPGHPLHIVHRGVNRGACFADDSDRQYYLGVLEEGIEHSGCSLHAYVLMTTHIHMLVTPADDQAPARLMKGLAQRHTQRFNKRWRRTGPLWEGRFKSSLVESAGYSLSCLRYVEDNPVRAGMVRHPAEYRWSSFRINGMGYPCPWLTEHETLGFLHEDPVERRIAYRRLFDTPMPEQELQLFRTAIQGDLVVGSPEFIERLVRATGHRTKRRNAWICNIGDRPAFA